MSSGIVVAFIEVQHGVQMDVSFACPLHQVAHKSCRLCGVVDVQHKITDAVDDTKPTSGVL